MIQLFTLHLYPSLERRSLLTETALPISLSHEPTQIPLFVRSYSKQQFLRLVNGLKL
jgi:hypothetical protein